MSKNMFNFLYFVFIATILISCGLNSYYVKNIHIIQNSSNHKILLEYNPKMGVEGAIVLDVGNSIESEYIEENGSSDKTPYFGIGLFNVVYDDTISIQHSMAIEQTLANNILRHESWKGGETIEKTYIFKYTFTDADFQEALDNQ